ncbi:MAG TPA: GNAT family N-acetyltransferase, partial [Candidatus Lokiarchaeia archaeon]|nr:GNAT family N-acetyltransferase [Candidatus Lokiarchaeia archaeon]
AVTILSGLNVDAIRLNFSYDVSPNLLERVSWAGFKPNAIVCEKTLTGSASEIPSSEQESGESEVVGTKSTQRITIRNYRKSDYDATTRIFRELAEAYNFVFEEDKWQESSGLRLFSPGYKRMTLIAEIGGEVVGLGFIEVKTEPTGELIGHLANWGIAKEFMKKGVGGKLLEKAVSILKKMGADAVRINFGYDVNEKLLNHVVNDLGFKPVAIVCEKKIMKKSGDKAKKQYPGEDPAD